MSVGPEAQRQTNTAKTDWMSILQLVFSLLVMFIFLGGAFLLAAAGGSLSAAAELPGMNPIGLSVLVSAFAALGLLNLPSVITSAGRLAGRERTPKNTRTRDILTWLPLLLFFGALAGLYFLPESAPRRGLLVGLLAVLGAAMPAVWLLRIGSAGLWGARARRHEGLLSFSIGFTTYFILIVEIALLVLLGSVIALAAASSPQIVGKLSEIWQLLQTAGADSESARESLAELARNPLVLALAFGMVAFLLPMFEEGFKTLGVWLLSDRKITAAEGYAAGLFSGAGFALVEALLNSAQLAGGSPAEWLTFLLGRFGGTLLHTFNGGLLGWAMARTWQDKRRGRTVGIFLLVLGIHALWNAAALANGLFGGNGSALSYLPMLLLGAVLMVSFLLFSRRVHQAQESAREAGQYEANTEQR